METKTKFATINTIAMMSCFKQFVIVKFVDCYFFCDLMHKFSDLIYKLVKFIASLFAAIELILTNGLMIMKSTFYCHTCMVNGQFSFDSNALNIAIWFDKRILMWIPW